MSTMHMYLYLLIGLLIWGALISVAAGVVMGAERIHQHAEARKGVDRS